MVHRGCILQIKPRKRFYDFRIGHTLYLIFFISFANFILIFHRLFIERMGIDISLSLFMLIFVILYIPSAIVIGVLHRRYQLKIETSMIMERNIYFAKMIRGLTDIVLERSSKDEIEKFREFLIRIETQK